LDISNELRSSSVRIRNTYVSKELKLMFSTNTYSNYKVSDIEVIRNEDGASVTALLYLPKESFESDYTNRNNPKKNEIKKTRFTKSNRNYARFNFI
jgi:hypothetical protein